VAESWLAGKCLALAARMLIPIYIGYERKKGEGTRTEGSLGQSERKVWRGGGKRSRPTMPRGKSGGIKGRDSREGKEEDDTMGLQSAALGGKGRNGWIGGGNSWAGKKSQRKGVEGPNR